MSNFRRVASALKSVEMTLNWVESPQVSGASKLNLLVKACTEARQALSLLDDDYWIEFRATFVRFRKLLRRNRHEAPDPDLFGPLVRLFTLLGHGPGSTADDLLDALDKTVREAFGAGPLTVDGRIGSAQQQARLVIAELDRIIEQKRAEAVQADVDETTRSNLERSASTLRAALLGMLSSEIDDLVELDLPGVDRDANDSTPEVVVSSPRPGTDVGHTTIMSGTWSGLSETQRIWIVTPEGADYRVRARVDLSDDHTWTSTPFKRKSYEIGGDIELVIIVVDLTVDAALRTSTSTGAGLDLWSDFILQPGLPVGTAIAAVISYHSS